MTQFERLHAILEEADYEPRSYSGRCMYGKECLGVVCDDENRLILDAIQAAVENLDGTENGWDELRDVIETLRNPKTDNMGRSIIVYWPNVEWE